MKNYLSLNERNTWLSSMVLVMYNENIIESWGKNLTKDETRKLKTSITMTKNALKSISDRMPKKEKDRIVKHSKDFEVRILNQTSAKVIENRAEKENRKIETDRFKFENIMTELIKVKCANCKINCSECDAYEFFTETLIPIFELENNCPYAFKTATDTPKKNKSRKEKKQKNRYDDPGEDYEYEFIAKGDK